MESYQKITLQILMNFTVIIILQTYAIISENRFTDIYEFRNNSKH